MLRKKGEESGEEESEEEESKEEKSEETEENVESVRVRLDKVQKIWRCAIHAAGARNRKKRRKRGLNLKTNLKIVDFLIFPSILKYAF